MSSAPSGPVVFAYDGSELAKMAIAESAGVLNHGRAALVLTVWQPFNVGFISPRELHIDAAAADEVTAALLGSRKLACRTRLLCQTIFTIETRFGL